MPTSRLEKRKERILELTVRIRRGQTFSRVSERKVSVSVGRHCAIDRGVDKPGRQTEDKSDEFGFKGLRDGPPILRNLPQNWIKYTKTHEKISVKRTRETSYRGHNSHLRDGGSSGVNPAHIHHAH